MSNSSFLDEYKSLQKKAVEILDKESKEYLEICDRMDVLWIRLDPEEMEDA